MGKTTEEVGGFRYTERIRAAGPKARHNVKQNPESNVAEQQNICSCAGAFPHEANRPPKPEVRVLILGADGWKRRWLVRAVSNALVDLRQQEQIGILSDPIWLERYYVLGSPALVINGTVVSVGCVLSRREARMYLEQYL